MKLGLLRWRWEVIDMNLQYTVDGFTKTYNNDLLATRPVITPSESAKDRYTIPGRRGEVIGSYETRNNAYINFMLHKRGDSVIPDLSKDIQWLRQVGGKLELSNDPNYCYSVLNTQVKTYVSKVDHYIRAEIEMEVYPFKFKVEPQIANNTVINAGYTQIFVLNTDKCEPLYKFTCTRENGTIEVNGNTFGVKQGTDVTIDTMLKVSSNESLINGNYEDLRLNEGSNNITAGSGVTLTIVESREGYIV